MRDIEWEVWEQDRDQAAALYVDDCIHESTPEDLPEYDWRDSLMDMLACDPDRAAELLEQVRNELIDATLEQWARERGE